MAYTLRILPIILLSVLGLSSYAQSYTVPNAQTQPDWVFPIWFEDGNGDRDTAYFCYDPNAKEEIIIPSSDSVFGEYYVQKDSTKFWAGIDGSLVNHLALNAYANKDPATGIVFNKGVYPLTLKWDVSLLDSPDLPYFDNTPHPRARIDIWCSDLFGNCPFDKGIVIHGDGMLQGTNYPWTARDSIVFTGDPGASIGATLGPFSLELVNYNAPLPVGTPKNTQPELHIYPNPVKGFLYIKWTGTAVIEAWKVYDVSGRLLRSGEGQGVRNMTTSALKPGFYILQLEINGKRISKYFLKQ